MHDFFRNVWDSREDENGDCYCYETGQQLPGYIYRSNTCCYHHILPKGKYPEYSLDEQNIVILHPDVHTQVESNIDKCPRVKELTDKIKRKYGCI